MSLRTEDSFYVHLLLDARNLFVNSANILEIPENCQLAVVSLALPKTFDNSVEYIQLSSNLVDRTPWDHRQLLLSIPAHNNDLSKALIHEPPNLQYHAGVAGRWREFGFRVTDEYGKVIEFDGGTVMVVLHFKWKKD
jgi:hypothetical protein